MKSSEDCGGITQEMLYISGPLKPLDVSSIYVMSKVVGDRTKITATITDESWYGTHTFIIRSTNGKLNTSSTAPGKNGLFYSVDSVPISITIKDPCDDSIVNSDNRFKISNPFMVTLGETEEVLN